MIEVEICPEQKRKLELVSRHRKSEIVAVSELPFGKYVAVIRKR